MATENGYLVEATFPNGRIGALGALLMGQAHIVAAASAERWRFGYDDQWMYPTLGEAEIAFLSWDGTGEPSGWVRHVPSYRRRDGGDPAKEEVRP